MTLQSVDRSYDIVHACRTLGSSFAEPHSIAPASRHTVSLYYETQACAVVYRSTLFDRHWLMRAHLRVIGLGLQGEGFQVRLTLDTTTTC